MIPLYNSNVIKPGNKILKRFKINTMEDEILICLVIQQIKLRNNLADIDISSSHENHHLCKCVDVILLFLKYCTADHSILV